MSDCGTMTIENGNFFSTSGTEEGESAFLSCNTGYILVGDHVINCTSSGWDGNGVCTPIGTMLSVLKHHFVVTNN